MKTSDIPFSSDRCVYCYWFQNCSEPDYDCNAFEIAQCTTCPFCVCSKCDDFDLFLEDD